MRRASLHQKVAAYLGGNDLPHVVILAAARSCAWRESPWAQKATSRQVRAINGLGKTSILVCKTVYPGSIPGVASTT